MKYSSQVCFWVRSAVYAVCTNNNNPVIFGMQDQFSTVFLSLQLLGLKIIQYASKFFSLPLFSSFRTFESDAHKKITQNPDRSPVRRRSTKNPNGTKKIVWPILKSESRMAKEVKKSMWEKKENYQDPRAASTYIAHIWWIMFGMQFRIDIKMLKSLNWFYSQR